MAQKKIPARQCIGCMTSRPKKELVRVVRAPSGEISIDPVGKKPGRGAYLCPDPACLAKAKKKKPNVSHTPMLRWKVTCREPPAPCADIRKALPVYWEQDRIPASTTVKKLFPMFLHWGTYWGTKEAEPCWVNAWWVTASKNSFPPTCANCC